METQQVSFIFGKKKVSEEEASLQNCLTSLK